MKKGRILLLAALVSLMLIGCGVKTKTLHCDHCGKAVEVSASSNMEESWILYCEDCQAALGLDHLIEER